MVGMRGGKTGKCARASVIIVLLGLGSAANARPNSTQESGPAAAALEVVPNVIRFPEVPVGETYTQAVRLANPGQTSIEIKKISVGARGFGISGLASPLVLAPGGSTNLTISYHPKAAGHLAVEMKIVTSADAAPVTVDVTASAIGGEAELSASEANLRFEDVAVGGRSVKEVSLTNTGNRDVRISRISISGGDFSVTGGGQVSLSPGQMVSLEVGFAPREAGERSAILSVFSEGATTPVQIPLSGAGAQASQSAIRLKWEESPLEAKGYRVYRSSESGGPYQPISAGGVNSAEYTDMGVAAGHTYYYVVTSIDANNQESEFSEQITAAVP
jgi:hypothetical protein